jgi:glutathione synthase
MSAKSRHLFVIDPIEKLNPAWDTTIKLAFVAHSHGDEVFCTELSGLIWDSSLKSVSALATPMNFAGSPQSVLTDSKLTRRISFSDFTVVHMRKEPPYDLQYIEALWILSMGRNQTKILNDPFALQQLNEKLMISEFSEFAKPMIVSSNADELFQFAQKHCDSDIVVKPLNLYGGRGIVHLNNAKSMRDDLYRETIQNTAARLVQKFEPKISDGEVRVFSVGGKAISWCLKVPAKGDFLANTRAGSRLEEYQPTAIEIKMVETIAHSLMSKGVSIAGFDLINGFLSEINITCPALLRPDRESLDGFERAYQMLMS